MPRASDSSGQSSVGLAATDALNSRRPTAKMPPLRRISSSFGESATGVYRFPCVTFSIPRDTGSNVNSSPSFASATASGHCTTCSPRLKAVAAEDVAHVLAADDHQLEADFFRNALQARGTHLARRSDREPIARDEKRLAAVHARAKIRHQVAERADLPAQIERLEALGHAIGGGRDLVRVDRVELLRLRRRLRIPEDQRAPADEARRAAPDAGAAADSGRFSSVTPGFSRAGSIRCIPEAYQSAQEQQHVIGRR